MGSFTLSCLQLCTTLDNAVFIRLQLLFSWCKRPKKQLHKKEAVKKIINQGIHSHHVMFIQQFYLVIANKVRSKMIMWAKKISITFPYKAWKKYHINTYILHKCIDILHFKNQNTTNAVQMQFHYSQNALKMLSKCTQSIVKMHSKCS